MSGDVSNVATWANADVVIGDLTATPPILGSPFSAAGGLKFLGIVTPDGFTESQSNDSTDIPGFGYGIVATVRSNQVYTLQVTALEDNIVALGLRYDTSGVTAAVSGPGYSGTLKTRDLTKKFLIGRQLQTGNTIKQEFSKNFVQIESIGDAQESETGVLQTQVTLKVYPNAMKELWDIYFGAALPAWQATHAYVLNDMVPLAGGIVKCTTAGTSGATIPTLPTTVSGTVTDGTTLVWTRVS